MSKETPLKLIATDFIMNHFITWEKFKEIGYPKDRLIDAAIPADSHIYRPLSLIKMRLRSMHVIFALCAMPVM